MLRCLVRMKLFVPRCAVGFIGCWRGRAYRPRHLGRDLYVRQAEGKTGQTWGRKIVGVKVVRVSDGQPPGFWRAFGRELFGNIISGQILYLGYLWMIWDKDRQTWHDKVAGTIVVKV